MCALKQHEQTARGCGLKLRPHLLVEEHHELGEGEGQGSTGAEVDSELDGAVHPEGGLGKGRLALN